MGVYFSDMKKILIGLVVLILLAVGARAFWAYQQMQKYGNEAVPVSITTSPEGINNQPSAVTTDQGQPAPQQVAKFPVAVTSVKQPTTASSQQTNLLSYSINQTGGYDEYVVSGIGLSNIGVMLLTNAGSDGFGTVSQQSIVSKTSNKIVFYVGASDITRIKEKKYLWMCGAYNANGSKCDTNKLPLNQ